MDKHNVMDGNGGGLRRAGCGAVRARRVAAFTLVELMVAMAIISVFALVGFPAYSQHVEKARIAQAIADILVLNSQLQRHNNDSYSYPADLSAIGAAGKLDPWGRPYRYLNLQVGGNQGQARKNRNLVPINTDFDLYSLGKDGASAAPLTARTSQDDVVRANDGTFVGIASSYGR